MDIRDDSPFLNKGISLDISLEHKYVHNILKNHQAITQMFGNGIHTTLKHFLTNTIWAKSFVCLKNRNNINCILNMNTNITDTVVTYIKNSGNLASQSSKHVIEKKIFKTSGF